MWAGHLCPCMCNKPSVCCEPTYEGTSYHLNNVPFKLQENSEPLTDQVFVGQWRNHFLLPQCANNATYPTWALGVKKTTASVGKPVMKVALRCVPLCAMCKVGHTNSDKEVAGLQFITLCDVWHHSQTGVSLCSDLNTWLEKSVSLIFSLPDFFLPLKIGSSSQSNFHCCRKFLNICVTVF